MNSNTHTHQNTLALLQPMLDRCTVAQAHKHIYIQLFTVIAQKCGDALHHPTSQSCPIHVTSVRRRQRFCSWLLAAFQFVRTNKRSSVLRTHAFPHGHTDNPFHFPPHRSSHFPHVHSAIHSQRIDNAHAHTSSL